MAIKVKCSNNDLFRVSPVYTCLEPGCSQRLQVIRDPGEPKVDKLIIIYKKTDCKNAHDAFIQNNNSEDDTEVKKALIALVALKHKEGIKTNSNNQDTTTTKENKKKFSFINPITPSGSALHPLVNGALKINGKSKHK